MLTNLSRAASALTLAGVVAFAAACNKQDATMEDTTTAAAPATPPAAAMLTVSGVTLGSAIGADHMVPAADSKSTFTTTDTIYASVAHEGMPPSATLVARWTHESGALVDSTSQVIYPTGPGATEFHIMKETPWPTGQYTVEILLDGVQVASKDFSVEQ